MKKFTLLGLIAALLALLMGLAINVSADAEPDSPTVFADVPVDAWYGLCAGTRSNERQHRHRVCTG